MKRSLSRLLTALALAGAGVAFFSQEAKAAERVPPNVALAALVSKVEPEMPAMAKQLRLSGVVELDVTIDEQGTVEAVNVLSGNPILSRAAENTMKKWKFRPIKKGDQTVKAIATFTFKYTQ